MLEKIKKHFKKIIVVIVGLFTCTAFAATNLPVQQGGTGLSTLTANSYLKGANNAPFVPRTYSEVKTDLSLNNVENTALSTWAGSGNITSLGTLTGLTVTNPITGSITGNAGTVSTIAGLAPNTATTQAAQSAITSLGKLINLDVGGATHYTEIKSDGEINLHGNARVIKPISIGAQDWGLSASAPPLSNQWGLFHVLRFDASSDDTIYYNFVVPSWWDSTTDIEFVVDWVQQAGEGENGTVCWKLEYVGKKDGENVGIGSTIISKVSAGNHTVEYVTRTTFTTKILASNLEKYDIVALKLSRDISEDTLAGDAHLLGVHLNITQNRLGEAL